MSRPLSPALIGSLAALGATVIWSGNFVIARGVSDAFPPVTLAFLRWTVACIALAPFALRAVIRDRALIRTHLRYLLTASLLGVTVFNTIIYIAGHHTTALNLALISTFIPAFILILSRIFLGEAFTGPKLAGLAAAVLGIVVLLTKGHPEILLSLKLNRGDLIMLGAALIFAAYSILIRKKPTDLGPATLLGASFSMGLIMLLPWMLFEQAAGPVMHITPQIVGSVLYIGMGASLVSYWLWNLALSSIGPAKAGFIYYSLPLFSGIEAALILGEPITWIHGASGALIIGGIFLATKYGNRIKN